MSLIPKYESWRPDFEAPGPHVEIVKDRKNSANTINFLDSDNVDEDDDDFPTYRYYESTKVLGKLYRAIDERSIFENIQQRAMRVGITSASTVIDAVWDFVQQTCKLIQWKHLLDNARNVRDMYAFPFLLLYKS